MNNQKFSKLATILALLLMNACASSPTPANLVNEARQEPVLTTSQSTQQQLLKILESDSSVTPAEREKLITLVDRAYAKVDDLELRANQKKSLLIKEYVASKPEASRISALKKAIRKLHAEKISEYMSTFDEMARIMKLHPQISNDVYQRTMIGFDRR